MEKDPSISEHLQSRNHFGFVGCRLQDHHPTLYWSRAHPIGKQCICGCLWLLQALSATPFGRHKEMADFPLKNAQRVADVECYPYLPKAEYWDSTQIETQIDLINQK